MFFLKCCIWFSLKLVHGTDKQMYERTFPLHPEKNDNINLEFTFASDLKLPRGCTSGVRGLLTPFFSRPNVIFIFYYRGSNISLKKSTTQRGHVQV